MTSPAVPGQKYALKHKQLLVYNFQTYTIKIPNNKFKYEVVDFLSHQKYNVCFIQRNPIPTSWYPALVGQSFII